MIITLLALFYISFFIGAFVVYNYGGKR